MFLPHGLLLLNRIRSKWGCDSNNKWCNQQLTPQIRTIMTYGHGFMFSTRWLDITTIGLTNRNVGYIWWLTKVSVNNLILLKRKKRKKKTNSISHSLSRRLVEFNFMDFNIFFTDEKQLKHNNRFLYKFTN